MIPVVVPTRNRSHLLQRLLTYCESVAFKHAIIVADSSDPAEREATRRVVDSTHGRLDVRLHEFSPDASISLKAAQAMATVESEFVALCADKDFVSPVGIDKCAAYLQANQDYATAQGQTVLAANVEPSSLNHETGMVVWRGDDFSCRPLGGELGVQARKVDSLIEA